MSKDQHKPDEGYDSTGFVFTFTPTSQAGLRPVGVVGEEVETFDLSRLSCGSSVKRRSSKQAAVCTHTRHSAHEQPGCTWDLMRNEFLQVASPGAAAVLVFLGAAHVVLRLLLSFLIVLSQKQVCVVDTRL